MSEKLPNRRHLLRTVFNFTYADIKANRNGLLSQRQKQRLLHLRLLSPWNFLALWAAYYCFGWLMAGLRHIIAPLQNQEWNAAFHAVLAIVWPALVIVIMGLFLIERWLKFTQDIRAGRIIQRQGNVEFRQKWNRTYTRVTLFIVIEGQEHPVMFWQQRAFRKGRNYRIYVTPSMKMIVSAELC
ncbi:MAG: hypothetical protein AAFX78_07940 [Cyanobacteria bacterium J06638_20]